MSLARLDAAKRPPDEDRRAHILVASERVFVRHGFHAATMTQVAEEAGMSAGNLYRYFPSKEAIVEGLCEADQIGRSDAFAALTNAGDFKDAMRCVLRNVILHSPREKARLIVEIWAESGRNPRVAEFTRRLDNDVTSGLIEVIELAKTRGVAAPDLDARFAARVMFSLVDGLFKRKALEAGFDAKAEAAMALGVFDSLFAGALAPAAEV